MTMPAFEIVDGDIMPVTLGATERDKRIDDALVRISKWCADKGSTGADLSDVSVKVEGSNFIVSIWAVPGDKPLTLDDFRAFRAAQNEQKKERAS